MLISTIIPVFNRPAMLAEAVQSVLAQTHRNIEVIVVDDGSTDDTPAMAAALAAKHAEVRVIRQDNRGPGLAREAGRLLARGELIQHLDSDDVLLPGKFALQLGALEASPECGVAYGWTRFRRPDGGIEPRPWKRSGEPIETMFPSMLTERWWDTPTPLYRASLLAQAGPWTDLRVEEDWEYDCRIASLGVKLAYCPEWVCEVRARESPYTSPAHLRDRAKAHLLMLRHARAAHLPDGSAEMQFFARDLFHLARQCGAAGLEDESAQLLEASRTISTAADLRVYSILSRLLGPRGASRLAHLLGR